MDDFGNLIAKSKIILLHFSADWCGPCQTLEPILEVIGAHYKDELTVLKIDVDKNTALARNFSIQSVPTMLLYSNGKEIWRQGGLMTKKELIKTIEKYCN